MTDSIRTEQSYPNTSPMKTRLIVLCCIAIAALTTKAETYLLTLQESIELAKEKSYTMRNLQENLKIAEYNLKSATSSLKTHIDLSLTMPEFNQTVRTWQDTTGVSFYSVKRMDYGGMIGLYIFFTETQLSFSLFKKSLCFYSTKH